jgi:hypothetical protein
MIDADDTGHDDTPLVQRDAFSASGVEAMSGASLARSGSCKKRRDRHGDAASNPIVETGSQFTAGLNLAYRF